MAVLDVAVQDGVEERLREAESWLECAFLEIWDVSGHAFVSLSPDSCMGNVEMGAELLASAAVF